jgi:hypothetical protein
MSDTDTMKALVDFACPEADCGATIRFDLLELQEGGGSLSCENCRSLYAFDQPFLDKLEKLRLLILAVRDAEDILGDCTVAVAPANGEEVRVPYRLLLTRLNTSITLDCSGHSIDFNFRVEPLSDATFR